MALNKLPPLTHVIIETPHVEITATTTPTDTSLPNTIMPKLQGMPNWPGSIKGLQIEFVVDRVQNTFVGANDLVADTILQIYNNVTTSWDNVSYGSMIWEHWLQTASAATVYGKQSIMSQPMPEELLGAYFQTNYDIVFQIAGLVSAQNTLILKNCYIRLHLYIA